MWCLKTAAVYVEGNLGVCRREKEGGRETDGRTDRQADRETKQMELGVDLNVLHDSRGNEVTLCSFSSTSLTFKTASI